MQEFRIYHVVRNLAKHNAELDDFWYGTPAPSPLKDWVLDNPDLYLKRLRTELGKVNNALADVSYLLQEKGAKHEYEEEVPFPTIETANAHAFHNFRVRQFEYAEKLSHQLASMDPNLIDVIIPKAMRQFNILLAAREDLMVTIVRFKKYSSEH